MKNDVVKTSICEVEEYDYKGLRIDKSTWEGACTPICCDTITEDDMCDIVVELYDTMVCAFGQQMVDEYIYCLNSESDIYSTNNLSEDEFENINDLRWIEEEHLFIDYGGIYYEDIENSDNN